MTADEIIATLGLAPHPEGGWYVQTFVDGAGENGRARSTAIYFLLRAGERSHWHRVDAVEIWHWHAGAPIELQISGTEGTTAHVLGSDLLSGQRPQVMVPAHAWQSARSLGDWTLVGCTVAPGFRFEGFELAPPGWNPER
jgi:predicted cupin superfamily sugar epimerase